MPDKNAPVRAYWNAHIHDLDVSRHAPGSREFFADLDAYHFEKLHHLLRLVDFEAWRAAMPQLQVYRPADAVETAECWALALQHEGPGVLALTRQNLAQQALAARLDAADGEALPFPGASFDFVYAHGVMQYTSSDRRLVSEVHRVLRPGGLAMFQAYNRVSWLNLLSNVMKVPLEHEDAPVLRRYSIDELRSLLGAFASIQIVPERFPVKSRLHKGWKAAMSRALRRRLQCPPTGVGAPVRLALAGVLQEVTCPSTGQICGKLTRPHAIRQSSRLR
jgi:SAM-dependent methyltransferase